MPLSSQNGQPKEKPKKFSVQARKSMKLVLSSSSEDEKPVGKLSENNRFFNHTCISFWNSLAGWLLLPTVSYWIHIPSTWQPLISIKTSVIVSWWLGHGLWGQRRDILTTLRRIRYNGWLRYAAVPLLFDCIWVCLSAAQRFSKKSLLID